MTQFTDSQQVMLSRLATMEGPHFRHQTRDEAQLSVEQKFDLAGSLLHRNPGEFLARYHCFLKWPDDAKCFLTLLEDHTVRFYLQEAGVVLNSGDRRAVVSSVSEMTQRRREIKVKNRRLMALRRMQAQAADDPTEGFFSQEQMRERAPELWERMVGQYLSSADRRALLGHQYTSFSGLLLSQLLESEQFADRVIEEDNSDKDEDLISGSKRTKQQECNNREFVELMRIRFLAGLDKDFDYEAVDNDTALDDAMEECDRDREEMYFDAESPSTELTNAVEGDGENLYRFHDNDESTET